MMTIKRRWQTKQRLQQPVHMGCAEQVHAAHDMRYTQLRIVESSGQMIAGGRILPRQYDVSRAQRIGHYRSGALRSEEHTSELQSLMRISYAVFCLQKKKIQHNCKLSTRLLMDTS